MPVKRRFARSFLALLALAALALTISACAVFKQGSLKLSQPAGIGSVRVHFELCTAPEGESSTPNCTANEESGQSQYILAISFPKGFSPPATITAAPVSGGAPIVYSRNDQAAQAFSAVAAEEGGQWPPAGSEGVGYLSAVFPEEEGQTREWAVDADFGLPGSTDGTPFAGTFGVTIGTGWREVSGFAPADRPVDCYAFDPPNPPAESDAICQLQEEGGKVVETGVSDLKIGAAPQTSAFLGGKGTLAFPLDFASTATALPSFNLAASSTLPKAKVTLASPTFAPGAPDPATRRSPLGLGTVNVTVPKNAKPGLYDVTLTATTAQGGSVSRVAKLKVTKPKIKLGGVKPNKAKGTAILSVKVPAAGTLTVSGKGLAKKKAKAKKAKRLKILVKPNAKTKALLAEEGKAKVKAKITFKPTGATAVVKTKSIVLKQS
ncbi:MAG TPA: hypothetical protein VF255_06810 [Solirubrobacterales bacterium]